MMGLHQYDNFSDNNTNLYSDNNGAYMGYSCGKWGKGNHSTLSRSGNFFQITVDFSKDIYTFQHSNQETSSSISSVFGSSRICFSFCLYYTQSLEIEFN